MKRTIMALVAAVTVSAALPAQAAFFLEGLKQFTAEPRCNDEYATDKTGCPVPDRSYPAPEKKAPKPDTRMETREGLDKK